MGKEAEIAEKFWKALRSDRTVMLGLAAIDEGHAQPMTAIVEHEQGAPLIWFFSSRRVDLVKALGPGKPAKLHFASKGHDLFATVHGILMPHNERATIDRLWNPVIAAWYRGGKRDPELQLLRFEPERAQIWLNEHSLFAGIKLMLGKDPKKAYKDKIAEVELTG